MPTQKNSDEIKLLETSYFKQMRKPEPSYISMRTIFFSTKMKMEFQSGFSENYLFENRFGGESHLEDALIILAEQCPQVIQYLPQSMPKNEKGIAKKLSYRWNNTDYDWIPDLCILFNVNGKKEIWVIEVKPLRSMTSKSQGHRLRVKFQFAKEICQKNGWHFYLFTDLFKKNTWRFDNITDMRSQMRWRNDLIPSKILELFESENQIRIKDILSALYSFSKSDLRSALYYLVFENKLFIDHSKPLNDDCIVFKKFPSHLSLIDWLNKFHFDNREKYLTNSIDINYSLDKPDWVKTLEDLSEKIIKYHKQGLSHRQISQKFKKEGLQISRSKIGRIIQQSQYGLLDKIIIKGKKGISGKRKKLLFELNDDGKIEFYDKFFKKVVDYYENTVRISKNDAWKMYYVQIRLEYSASGLVNTDSNIQELLEKIPEMATKYVFTNNLKNYIEIFEKRVTSKREGMKVANKAHRDIRGITPHQLYVGQTIEIDHTPSDIIPVISPHNYYRWLRNNKIKLEKLPRPSLTIAIDRHSRVIVGYALRHNAPSSETDHLVLRRTMLGNVSPLYSEKMATLASSKEKIRVGYESLSNREIISEDTYFGTLDSLKGKLGVLADWFDSIRVIPHTLAMDNGSDFTSTQLAYLGKNVSIDFNYRPVGGSNYGGMVERAIKTINYNAFHNLPGTTKGTIQQKGDIDPDKYKILKFEELEAILLIELLNYHVIPHTGLGGLTPKVKWDKGIENGHVLLPTFNTEKDKIKYFKEIAFHSLPTALNSHNNIPPYHENKGIVLSKIWYNYSGNDLYSQDVAWSYIYIKGDPIETKQSKDDVRFVYWYNNKIDRVVKVWATVIKINNVQYSGKSLEKLPPLSLDQIKDEAALSLIYNKEELKIQERLLAHVENVQVSTTMDLIDRTGTKKKKSKRVAQMIEKQELQKIESNELQQNFEQLNQKSYNPKRSRKKSKKIDIDEEINWDDLPVFPKINDKERK